MKSISVTEFKAHCLKLVNEVGRTGESVILTKRGKPTAMVVPPPETDSRVWVPGRYEGKMKIVGDIVNPLVEEWDALK